VVLDVSDKDAFRMYRLSAELEHRDQWIDFHRGMSELHNRLSEEHAAKAEALLQDDPHTRIRAGVYDDGSGPSLDYGATEGQSPRTKCNKEENSR
jgi:hypothetical protein